jgi:hypothetical protein
MIVWKEFTPSYIPMLEAVKYTTNQTYKLLSMSKKCLYAKNNDYT